MADWRFFYGNGEQQENVAEKLKSLEPPPWRKFGDEKEIIVNDERWEKLQKLAENNSRDKRRGENFRIPANATDVINAVNAAIYLRRPLLVTGRPGSGKTSLAYAIAYELKLGPVLSWAITARSTLQEGLYRYDAIGRLQDVQEKKEQEIGRYIKLGSLGTAFLPSDLPRVLLIDEIDKSDINLPNDLLNLFEEGEFEIPELIRRFKSEDSNNSSQFTVFTQDPEIEAVIDKGRVRCYSFPIIIMTSNGERDFPPAFKRRCLRVRMPDPDEEALKTIVKAHLGEKAYQKAKTKIDPLIKEFTGKNQSPERATDQLLNTIYLLTREVSLQGEEENALKELLFKSLSSND